MSVQIPVPVVIYGLVLLAYTVSQYFTVKYLCEAIKAMREERAELWRLSQRLNDSGLLLTDDGGKEMSTTKRSEVGS